ncbi:glucosaminidase domain-containing protein [Ferruginibacter sp. HRS2-29]|uniref:glucosaminidase domain-containing protein n=1 Tax=Ferruginibacter sp. HRS2-29 TaxID=2487334 RepID=UPI0020CD7E48|nr:glucosaminidase domain-containing protein [Ferruginibacter sp. HRS2-29]MCP9750303.1 muramidase [Ferruginibacter sp. HRS2-29]
MPFSLKKKLPQLFACILLLCFCSFSFVAQSQSAYIKKYKPLATELSAEFGIPASVILGVAIVESSSGTSRNTRLLNNHFGIVGRNTVHKTKGIKTRYKQYATPEASFRDFCRVISRKKFYPKLKGNPKYLLWLDAISKTGYSEAPAVWKKRIAGVIQKNKL